MRVLVSACLLGQNCKYNGGNNYSQKVIDFVKDKEVIAVCPEMLSGVSAPRPCVELVNGKLVDENGRDVDRMYRSGVEAAMKQIEGKEIDLAILQSRSPTCGVRQVYDGSFSGKLVAGSGVLAEALMKAGYRVMDAEELDGNCLAEEKG